MEVNEIRAELVRQGISQVSIAKKLKITRGSVNGAISRKRKSKRIQAAIAKILKRPYSEVWGTAA